MLDEVIVLAILATNAPLSTNLEMLNRNNVCHWFGNVEVFHPPLTVLQLKLLGFIKIFEIRDKIF